MNSEQEEERVKELRRFLIMDSEPEKEFDDITNLMAKIAEVPICLISLLDESRQWFKSATGLAEKETPKEFSICQYTIQQDHILEIEDTFDHPTIKLSPLVTGHPHIRFYAGAPLKTSNGHRLGSLCVIDTKPRRLTALQREALETLAAQVVRQMESRLVFMKYKSTLLEFQNQKNSLKESNQVKEKLLSILSHDLRSPLSQLKNYTGLLNKGSLAEEESAKILSGIDDQLNQTLTLVDNLLIWSKDQSDGFKVDIKQLELRNLTEDVLNLFQHQVRKKNIRLNIQIPESLVIHSDEQILKIICRNLISNALKFSREGDSITIEGEYLHGKVELRIHDTGIGMSKEAIDQVMKVQLIKAAEGTHMEKGMGIGLSLSSGFARMINAEIQLLSKIQEGTTAIVRMPAESFAL